MMYVHKSLVCMHARDGFIFLVASLSLTAHQELYKVCSQTINPCSTIWVSITSATFGVQCNRYNQEEVDPAFHPIVLHLEHKTNSHHFLQMIWIKSCLRWVSFSAAKDASKARKHPFCESPCDPVRIVQRLWENKISATL